MKKIFLSLLLFFIIISGFRLTLNAQTLYFCEGVDASWYPINDSNVFIIKEDAITLFFLVRSPYYLTCTFVNYKIYLIDGNGGVQYYTTIKQENMRKESRRFWRKVTFSKAGTFNVYVYDCDEKLLTNSKITIKYKD